MKNLLLFSVIWIICLCLIPQSSHSGTIFCIDKGDQLLVGKNQDWIVDDCLILINKRGVKKTAVISHTQASSDQPASWISKYGSLTFNQYGREIPAGGINEAGLVVQSAALKETKYPASDNRAAIGAGPWQQYMLDNFNTVEEVIESHSKIRIKDPQGTPGRHFFVTDKMSNCAIIEFIDGKMVYYANEKMPVNVITNSTYSKSIEFWKRGKLPDHDPYRSVDRFVSTANMLKNNDPKKSAIEYAFEILQNVSLGEIEEIDGVKVRSFGVATEFSIVYDIKNLRIYFSTLENQNIRSINLNSFDFSCKKPVKVLDIQSDLSGDVTKKFIDYTHEINRKLVSNAFKKTLLFYMPDEAIDAISRYPETTICTE